MEERVLMCRYPLKNSARCRIVSPICPSLQGIVDASTHLALWHPLLISKSPGKNGDSHTSDAANRAFDWPHLPASLHLSADWHVRCGQLPGFASNSPQAETSPVRDSGSIRSGPPSTKWISFDDTGAWGPLWGASPFSVTLSRLILGYGRPWPSTVHLYATHPVPLGPPFFRMPCPLSDLQHQSFGCHPSARWLGSLSSIWKRASFLTLPSFFLILFSCLHRRLSLLT